MSYFIFTYLVKKKLSGVLQASWIFEILWWQLNLSSILLTLAEVSERVSLPLSKSKSAVIFTKYLFIKVAKALSSVIKTYFSLSISLLEFRPFLPKNGLIIFQNFLSNLSNLLYSVFEYIFLNFFFFFECINFLVFRRRFAQKFGLYSSTNLHLPLFYCKYFNFDLCITAFLNGFVIKGLSLILISVFDRCIFMENFQENILKIGVFCNKVFLKPLSRSSLKISKLKQL